MTVKHIICLQFGNFLKFKMDQSHENKENPLPSQNAHVDASTATTSDLVVSRQSRKRTASDARININQCKEHKEKVLNINVANADGVPSKKKKKVEVKHRTQSRSEKCSNTGEIMDMTMFCRHDIVTSIPKPNPDVLPIYIGNHAITTELSPIQKNSLPLSGYAHNQLTNFVKVPEDIQKLVLRYTDDANEPSIPCEIVESLCIAPGRNGSIPVKEEDVIVISDSNNSAIDFIPGPSAPTKNNQAKRRQQKKTKDPKKEIPISLSSKEQVSTSSIHLENCPICLEVLDKKSISCTICGHIFCTPCITKIIKSRKECPICRIRLTKTKMHPLYI